MNNSKTHGVPQRYHPRSDVGRNSDHHYWFVLVLTVREKSSPFSNYGNDGRDKKKPSQNPDPELKTSIENHNM